MTKVSDINLQTAYKQSTPVSHYYHRDHLGNTCAVWNATADSVVQRTLYYASGMPMAGSTGQPYQPYKYNGKEFVNEYGYDEYDSQARWYYPAVMRTTTIDPLSETYYATSPYVWCANNPVNMIDSDGMTWRYADGNEITDHSKVMVYIFYDPNSFEKQSNQIYMDAVKKYGEGSAALSNVTTEKEFAQDWGNMASPNIKEVNLNYHGNNQTLMLDHANGQYITATGNGKSNVSSTPSKNVQDLSAPLGDISNAQLNINSCKSNSKTQYPLKGSGQTLMEAFAYTFNFKTIRGTSAGVSYNRFTMQPEPQFFWQSWDYIGKIPVLPTSSSNVSNSVYYRTGGMK